MLATWFPFCGSGRTGCFELTSGRECHRRTSPGPSSPPSPTCLIHVERQVLGNQFVSHLSLTVALRVVCQGGGVHDLEQLKEVCVEFGTKLLALVRDDLQWDSEARDPLCKDGRSHGEGLLVGDGHHLCVLGEGGRHAENVLFSCLCLERPKQVGVDSLLWLPALSQGRRQHWWLSWVSSPPDLATVALLQMFLDVGIHPGPIVAQGDSFLGFCDAVVSGQHVAVGIGKNLRYEFPRR